MNTKYEGYTLSCHGDGNGIGMGMKLSRKMRMRIKSVRGMRWDRNRNDVK